LFASTMATGPSICSLYTRPTSNGGESFGARRAELVRTKCGDGQALSAVAFDRAGVLFAYGPGLEVSRNLGRSWESPRLPRSVVGLATQGQHAWALVTRCPRTEQDCTLTLLESADEGDTWRPPSAQPPDHVVVGPVAADSELGMSTLLSVAPDGTVVLALPGLPPTAKARFRSTATVESLRANAGRWSEVQVPCASSDFETELSIAPDGSRWLACASEPSTGVQPKSLEVSDARGTSWRLVSGMCDGAGCHQRMPLSGYLGGLAALSASSAFYIGDRSSLVGTFDGGMKWRTWQRVGGQDTGTVQVSFFGSHDGWAVTQGDYGHSSLWRTHDGGRIWTDR
jgi:hypothetical protein